MRSGVSLQWWESAFAILRKRQRSPFLHGQRGDAVVPVHERLVRAEGAVSAGQLEETDFSQNLKFLQGRESKKKKKESISDTLPKK